MLLVGIAFLTFGLLSATIYARINNIDFLKLIFFADTPPHVRAAVENGLPIYTAFVDIGFFSSLCILYGAFISSIVISVALPWNPSRLFQLHSTMLGLILGYYSSLFLLGVDTNGIFFDILRLSYIVLIYVTIERVKAVNFTKLPAGYYYPYLLDGTFALLATVILVQLVDTPTALAFASPLFLLFSFVAMPIAEQTLVRLKVSATLAKDDMEDELQTFDVDRIVELPTPQKAKIIGLLFVEMLKFYVLATSRYARMSWRRLEVTFRERVPNVNHVRDIMDETAFRIDRKALVATCLLLTVWAPILAVAGTLGLRLQIWFLTSLGLVGG